MRISITLLATCLVVALSAPLQRTKAQTASAGTSEQAPYNYTEYRRASLKSHFPDVELLTQDKKKVRFYSDLIKDRTVVIQFFFADCREICPLATPIMAQAQRELNQKASGKVTFLSITVDPENDTPAAIKHYSTHFNPQPGWYFLTGKKENVDLIRKQLGVWDPDEKKTEHMNVLTIGNEPAATWLAMESVAKPSDISQTVMRIMSRSPQSQAQR